MTGRVLIVDDEEAIRYFASYGLTQAGWHVHEVGSGEEALAWLEYNSCDVILLDLHMAGIDGLEVLRHVKENSPEVMVVIMTAYATIESAIEAVRQGAFDYLQKPCMLNDIIACTSRAMAEKAKRDQQRKLAQQVATNQPTNISSSPHIIKSGALVIKLGSHTVLLEGKQVSLTPTEYGLLKILSQTLGQSVSIEDLIEQGLGYRSGDPQSLETLRVHISRLRRKLGSGYVVTVRGGGYTLANIPPV